MDSASPSYSVSAAADFKMDEKDGYIKFTRLHAIFLASSIVTYLANITLDVILAFSYLTDGYYGYALVTSALVVVPTVVVQVFSARWHVMDEVFDKATAIIHAVLLGVLHRYLVVISLGMEAMRTDDNVDYRRFYQQQSDVCMLRLFDSFLESAPQLVFHLYVMMHRKEEWSAEQAAWTALSAIVSMVSLGWGIAAYSSAMRMVRTEKGNLSWAGMVLQTVWRFGMLSARIVALVLLMLTIHEWVAIVLFVHWLVMTAWVVWQDTDFCSNQWEERLYNAVVGVIYCFCFFNLKEGNSRWRASLFYAVVVVENLAFVTAFNCYADFQDPAARQNVAIAAYTFVTAGTSLGLMSMLLYYRFFHPAGPINPCSALTWDVPDKDTAEKDQSASPDFEVDDDDDEEEDKADPSSPAGASTTSQRTPPRRPPRRRATQRVQYSRSFKDSCPRYNRKTPKRKRRSDNNNDSGNSGVSSVTPTMHATGVSRVAAGHQFVVAAGEGASPTFVPDSAYGTDTNSRSTTSPVTTAPNGDGATNRSGSSLANRSTGSSQSQAFNNETYMSIEGQENCESQQQQQQQNNTYNSVRSAGHGNHNPDGTMSDFSQCSADSRVTVINKRDLYATPVKKSEREVASNPERPLKRSPVLKDVIKKPAAGVGGGGGLTAPLTIIIPNISHQAFQRSSSASSVSGGKTNSGGGKKRKESSCPPPSSAGKASLMSVHDYENLALVNINRARLGGVSHWRTYSDMAGGGHDESTAYEKKDGKTGGDKGGGNSDYSNYSSLQYYDIMPLSREVKERLYRSLTPVSTTATVATSGSNTFVSDSDTYEPIETYAVDGSGGAGESRAAATAASSSLPMTLIHHDGTKMTTRQVVSLENLKSVLQQHEAVPMDDPQERGDLYLLAPMRLLTPIVEESECGGDTTRQTESTHYQGVGPSRIQQQHPQQQQQQQQQQQPQPQQQVNRSILTVISEILNGSYSLHAGGPSSSSLLPAAAGDSPAGHGWDDTMSVEPSFAKAAAAATSSLVHTIDEVRNNSLCNLFFSPSSLADASGSSGTNHSDDSSPKVTAGREPVPQVPPRNSSSSLSTGVPKVIMQTADEVGLPTAGSKTRNSFARDSSLNASVKSINSNTLVASPSTVKKRPRSTSELERRDAAAEEETEPRPALPAKQASTPLLSTSAGSRKNIVELAGNNSADILNTPRRPPPSKIPQPLSSAPPPGQPASSHRPPPPPLSLPREDVAGVASAPATPTMSKMSLAAASSSMALQQSRVHELSMSLSPSSKYETPTPPLRPNQFVRSYNATRLPRRKFSILRQKFEDQQQSPQQQQSLAPAVSHTDLYQNISDGDLLHNDLSEISAKSASTPSFFLDSRKFELRADQRYDNGSAATTVTSNMLQRGWATSSTRYTADWDDVQAAKRRDRRSMSAIEDQENLPPSTTTASGAPPLGPKPRRPPLGTSRLPVAVPVASPPSSSSSKWSPHLSGGQHARIRAVGSLSPRSKIFDGASRAQKW